MEVKINSKMIYKLLFKLIESFFINYQLHEIYKIRPTISIIDKKITINRGYKQFKQMNRKQFKDNSL